MLAALAAEPQASSGALGARLGVQSGTARKYLEALRKKLGATEQVTKAELVRLARARGLLPAADASDRAGEGGDDDCVCRAAAQRKVLAARAAAPAATAVQLGAVVGVKDSTVRDTLSKLRRRVAVGDDAALVRLARERGLLVDPVPEREGAR